MFTKITKKQFIEDMTNCTSILVHGGYCKYENEYGFFAEAYDEEYPIRVRHCATLEQVCKWMENAIDRWIEGGKYAHLTSIQRRSEQLEFRTR